MHANEFLATYPAKLMEYALAVGYLLLFIPFWRYLQGGRERRAAVAAPAGAVAGAPGWFALPGDVLLHPGHTWARAGAGGLVEVGLDELASRLLGPVELELPAAGAALAQGSPALSAADGGRRVGLLSPLDGTVAEVNPAAASGAWQREPYAGGWLLKVRPARLEANARQLLSGEAARRWLEQAGEALLSRASHGPLGAVLADGGTPVHGIARELEPERWDALCREIFRS
jgi:glycine cleavage system H protein